MNESTLDHLVEPRARFIAQEYAARSQCISFKIRTKCLANNNNKKEKIENGKSGKEEEYLQSTMNWETPPLANIALSP